MSYQEPIKYYELNPAGQLVSSGTGCVVRMLRNLSSESIYINTNPDVIDNIGLSSWEIKAGKDFPVYGNAVLYAAAPNSDSAPLQVWEFYN